MRDFFFDRLMFRHHRRARPRHRLWRPRRWKQTPSPNTSTAARPRSFPRAINLYNFATARAAAIKAGTIIVAEGYMDVIALVRGGFAHAVAPLGTALTSDQLQLLWRTAPEPILAFDGDDAGLKAAHRAAHLALPQLKAGYSLRFAFLPAGEDPDSFLAKTGPAAMRALLDAALPLSEVLWRAETEGKDFSTPERRAGLERVLSRHRRPDHRRQDRRLLPPRLRPEDLRQFQAPGPASPRRSGPTGASPRRGQGFKRPFRPQPGTAEAVSPAVKASLLARAGQAGQVREGALARQGDRTGRPVAGASGPGPCPWGNAGRAAVPRPFA